MTISDLPIGVFLSLGKARELGSNGAFPIIWKKTVDNMFYTERAFHFECVDAPEPENKSRDRRERGSNFFPQTNLFQFLNSESGEWFVKQHDADEVNPGLANRPGFLNRWEDFERKLLVPHAITVVVPAGFKRQFGEQVQISAKVSILSKSQAVACDERTEGEHIFMQRPANFVTRTAESSSLAAFDYRGRPTTLSPCARCGVIPVIKLNDDAPVEYDEETDCYYPVPPDEEKIVGELTELLG